MKFNESELGWTEFDLGGPSLGLERVAPDDAEGAARVGRLLGVSLQMENIDEIYRDLCNKGVEFTSPPEKQSWGGSLAHFKDPEGNVLTFQQQR